MTVHAGRQLTGVNNPPCLLLWQEREVITMALMGIRGMDYRDGKSISEIARLTSLSRNTIEKWWKAPQGAAPGYQRRDVPTKLTPFMATLTQALEPPAPRPAPPAVHPP